MIKNIEIGIIVFVIFALGIGLMIYRTRERHKSLESLLHEVSKKVKGCVVNGNWRYAPELQFEYKGCDACVEYYTLGRHDNYYKSNSESYSKSKCYTRLWVMLPSNTAGTCRISTRRLFTKAWKAFGVKEVEIQDKEFTNLFVIVGSNGHEIRTFLSEGVRKSLMDLRSLVKNGHLDVRIKGGELRISKLSWLTDKNLLSAFIELGLSVFDGYISADNITTRTGA